MKRSLKFLFTILVALLIVQPLFADKYAPKRIPVKPGDGENTIFIYRNDGDFLAMFDNEIDSITYSNFDEDFNHYDYPVMQYVYARDSCYMMPLEVVDSIGLRTPDIIMKKGLIELDDITSQYVVAFDSISVTFAYNTPAMFLPEEGNLLYCARPNDVFPNSLAARVTSVTDCGFGVRCELDYHVSPGDIYDQYISVGRLDIEEDEEGNKTISVRSSSKPAASCKELIKLLNDMATELKLKVKIAGAPWNEDGLKVALVVEKEEEKDNHFYGSVGPYIRLRLWEVDKIDGKDNLSRLTAGMYIGADCDIHANLSKAKKFIDPDNIPQSDLFVKAGKIPIGGTPFLISFDPFRPLVEISGKLELALEFSGEVGYEWVWLLDWDKGPMSFAKFESDKSGFKVKWDGSVTASGKADFFVGLVPEIKLSIFSDNVCSLVWEGKFGAVLKGTVTVDPVQLARTSTLSEWRADNMEQVTNHYRNILSHADKAGLKAGPRMEQVIKVEILNGLIDDIVLFDTGVLDPDRTSQLPGIGSMLEDMPLSFKMPWTPVFSDLDVEHPSQSQNTYQKFYVRYGLKSRSFGPHTLGLAVCDVEDNKATLYRCSNPEDAKIKPFQDTSNLILPFDVKLHIGKQYVLYPVCIGATDNNITWG